MSEIENSLPNNAEAEKALLGLLMRNPMLIDQVSRAITPEAFYVIPHRKIYGAMLDVQEREGRFDAMAVASELRGQGAIQSAGGTAFVISLDNGIPFSDTASYYLRKVVECAERRKLVKLASYLHDVAMEGEEPTESIRRSVVADLDQGPPAGARDATTLMEMANDQLLRYQHFFKGVSNALPTGFPELDSRLMGGGLVASGLYILAAATSMGKTTLALDVAANIAKTKKAVCIVTREMSREQLFDRLAAVEADVDRWMLRPGIYQRQYDQVRRSVITLAEDPIILDDVSSSVSEIRTRMKERERRGTKIDLVVIDYLQLLTHEGRKNQSRAEEVGLISRALKGLAMEFQIPVLALSQLNRSTARDDREPELHDLRESGQIEQDADAVFFLFGEKPMEGAKIYNRTFKCSKQREGPLFRVEEMPFDARLVTYRRAEHFPNAIRGVSGSLYDEGESSN